MDEIDSSPRKIVFPELPEGMVPPITEEMIEIATQILGEYTNTYKTDDIAAYYANKRPSFRIGFIFAEPTSGENTWENAWDTFTATLEYLVNLNNYNTNKS